MIWSKTVLVWNKLDICVDSESETIVLSQLGREAR